MSQMKKDFQILNVRYQECLNKYYDDFFEGKTVNFENNLCNKILEEMKTKGNYWKLMSNEYKTFMAL